MTNCGAQKHFDNLGKLFEDMNNGKIQKNTKAKQQSAPLNIPVWVAYNKDSSMIFVIIFYI